MQEVFGGQPLVLLPRLLEKRSLQGRHKSSRFPTRVQSETEPKLGSTLSTLLYPGVLPLPGIGRFSVDFRNPNPTVTAFDSLVV